MAVHFYFFFFFFKQKTAYEMVSCDWSSDVCSSDLGGGMMIAPGAKLEEPWFEVYVLPPLPNKFAYLRALGGCMRGKPEVCGGVLVRGRHIRANSSHQPWVEA